MKPPLFVKVPDASCFPDGLQIDTLPFVAVLSEKASDIRCPALASTSRRATFSAGSSTDFDSPSENLPVEATFDTAVPLGGMKRSGPTLVPVGVVTETRPPSVSAGTLNLIELDSVEVNSGLARLTVMTSEAAAVSKFAPEIVISSPAATTVGEIDEIFGADDSATVKLSGLVTGPSSPTATVTDPDFAPDGTLTVSEVAVAALTVALVPLNLTVFDEGVVENPVPSIVTVAPTSPRDGLSWTIESLLEA